MQQACFHKERRRDGRRGRGRILINGSLRQASMASGGFAAPLCKNNSDLQAPPGRCAWGAWGCVVGALFSFPIFQVMDSLWKILTDCSSKCLSIHTKIIRMI